MPCYLLHFDRPLGNPSNPRGQAQHYLGSTDRAIEQRFAEHLSGRGAKITRAAVERGIQLQVVRVWHEGSRELEIWLKEAHRNALYCPICNPTIDQRVQRLIMIKQLQKMAQECEGTIDFLKVVCEALEPFDPDIAAEIRESIYIREIPSMSVEHCEREAR